MRATPLTNRALCRVETEGDVATAFTLARTPLRCTPATASRSSVPAPHPRTCHAPYQSLLCQVETEGDVATAFTLARILSNIPPSRGGPTSLVVFDIHALQAGNAKVAIHEGPGVHA